MVRQSRINDSLFGKEQHLRPVLAVAEVITFHNEAFFIFSDGDAFPLSCNFSSWYLFIFIIFFGHEIKIVVCCCCFEHLFDESSERKKVASGNT